MSKNRQSNGVMLNAYPDSCGGTLNSIVNMLNSDKFENIFSSFYILPTLFESDLDRGFSVVSYNLNSDIVDRKDLINLQIKNIDLKLDFVLNHLSVQSPQFQDILKYGDESEYVDTFIDWNKFWLGKGEMGPEGYIIPGEQYLSKLFMRKPGFPILKVPFPDGTYRFYWNTFYQKVTLNIPEAKQLTKIVNIGIVKANNITEIIKEAVDNSTLLADIDFGDENRYKKQILSLLERECLSYLGQMDLNADSKKVWDFYEDTFRKLSEYGAKIVRLDAFAYLHKEIGYSNFFNEPGTWDHLAKIKDIADRYNLVLLPEIHSKYEDKLHLELAKKGYPIYDFFFPGLVIDAIESGENKNLLPWISEIIEKELQTFNMLGCHDGIPVLDVQGLLDNQRIEELMTLIKSRGGRIKDLFGPDGTKISYYQINATFFSALDENEKKLLLARAIQMFMPGTPIVWYLDLFAGKNNEWAADNIGHKDINRTNLTNEQIETQLKLPLVQDQLKLLRFRNTNRAFGKDSKLTIEKCDINQLKLSWVNNGYKAKLHADLKSYDYVITYKLPDFEWEKL